MTKNIGQQVVVSRLRRDLEHLRWIRHALSTEASA
jgi:hypothetical protein